MKKTILCWLSSIATLSINGGVSKLAHPLLTYHKARTFTSTGFAIP